MVPLKAVLSLYSADSGDSMVFVSTKFHGVRSQPIVQSVENFVIQNAVLFLPTSSYGRCNIAFLYHYLGS